nr:CrcB family protein [Auraticoccus cholistanensis]
MAVAVGGLAGGALRGWLGLLLPSTGDGFPRAVLVCNVVGSFVLGLAAALLLPGSGTLALVGTGFCGALTTWSTFSLDLVALLRTRARRTAAVYALTSLGAGLAAAWAGLQLGAALAG